MNGDAPPEVQQTEVRAKQLNRDAAFHVVIVLVVLLSATVLRAMHDIDTPTYSAIAVGSLGYATGLVNKRSAP